MNMIQAGWNLFETLVIPKNADEIQRQEMYKAFYAGAYLMMNVYCEIVDESTSEEAGKAIIDGCNEELNMFLKQIQDGGA